MRKLLYIINGIAYWLLVITGLTFVANKIMDAYERKNTRLEDVAEIPK